MNKEPRNDSPAKGVSLRLAKYPSKLLHYLEFGVFLGAVLALTIHSAQHKTYIPKEIGEEEMIELPTRELPEHEDIGTGEAIIDTDGDGIPDEWETQFSHNPNDVSDKDRDFDLDGLTALQEYQVYVSSSGTYGNPLGKYTTSVVVAPSGYILPPSLTLIEAASNGYLLIRVNGVLEGATTRSNQFYLYRPQNQTWAKITPPAGVSASINCLDINAAGQVAGYYSLSGYKGFIWSPASATSTTGTAAPYVINPTSATSLQRIPIKISNTGYSLYASSPSGARFPADHRKRSFSPIAATWVNPAYLDVNDYGEFVGTVIDPFTQSAKTFLVIPEGMMFLTELSFDELWNSTNTEIQIPNVDFSSLDWQSVTFTYPDDYFNEFGGVDPYEANGISANHEFSYATDSITQVNYVFRRDAGFNSNFIFFKIDDADNSYAMWNGFDSQIGRNLASVNDWGEFIGLYSFTTATAQDYGYYEGNFETETNSDYNQGAFVYDGSYKLMPATQTIRGFNNQKQVLSARYGVNYLWSDGVSAALSQFSLGASYATICKLSDHGQIAFNNRTITILTPDQDSDGDGDELPDDWEMLYGFNPELNDSLDDSDGDGLNNFAEYKLGTNPTVAPVFDENGEEIDMREGIDSDGDGIPNTWEYANAMDYLDPADAGMDFDRDGFNNLKEFQLGTDHRGAPSYQIHQPGPFADTLYPTILQAQLGAGRNAATCLLPLEPSMRDDLFFCVTPAGYSGGQIPAVWRKDFGSESGSFVTYPDSATLSPCSTIASSASGAYLGQTYGSHCEFHYWASPTANLISLSGSSEQNDISSLSLAKFSPAALYLTASRITESEGSVAEFIIWKMPLSETQTWTPVVLPSPAGVTLVEGQMIHVNDYGFAVGAGIDQTGKTVAVLWELNATGTAVSTTQLQTLASDGWATVIGITNQPSPIIVGNALSDTGQTRAVAWTTSGAITSLGTLPDGNYSEAIALSPAGFIAGKANTVENGNPVTVPFIANPPQAGTDYRLIPQEYDNESFQIYSIADSGEALGIGHIYTPAYRQVPIIWSHGKSRSLEYAIPPSSGYVLDAVQHINSNGSLLATAWKDNALVKLLLTADRDTDGDGMPDAYENLNDFNPYLANNAEDDADSDGLSDLNEFRYATDARSPDSDGDGMKDGWEVDWGFLPLDPSDADLDPDQDRVTNLRESQIGTSPTGYYKVETILTDVAGQYPSLHSVNDAGNIIHTGETLYDSGTNEDMLLFSSQTQAFHGLTQGATTPVNLPSYVNSYNYNEDWTLYNFSYQYPSFYLDSESNGVHGFVTETYYGSDADGSYFSESSYLIPDAVSQLAQESWIPWTTVEQNLQFSYDADSYPIIGYDQALSPYAEAVSPDGNRRIHRRSDGVAIVLDASGIYVSTLQGPYAWNVINHQGDAAAVSYSALSQPDGSQITIPEVIVSRNGSSSQFPLIEALNANVTLKSLSDDGKLLLSIENHAEHGFWHSIDHLLDVNDGSIRRIRMPGLGNESILSLSRANGMTLGYGPKPFFTTADGTCVRIEALRIKNQISDSPISFREMHPADYSANHISSSGIITVTTTNQVGQIEFLRLIPHNDADGDGVPDDWEIVYAQYLEDFYDVEFTSLQANQVNTLTDYTNGDGITASTMFNSFAKVLGSAPSVRASGNTTASDASIYELNCTVHSIENSAEFYGGFYPFVQADFDNILYDNNIYMKYHSVSDNAYSGTLISGALESNSSIEETTIKIKETADLLINYSSGFHLIRSAVASYKSSYNSTAIISGSDYLRTTTIENDHEHTVAPMDIELTHDAPLPQYEADPGEYTTTTTVVTKNGEDSDTESDSYESDIGENPISLVMNASSISLDLKDNFPQYDTFQSDKLVADDSVNGNTDRFAETLSMPVTIDQLSSALFTTIKERTDVQSVSNRRTGDLFGHQGVMHGFKGGIFPSANYEKHTWNITGHPKMNVSFLEVKTYSNHDFSSPNLSIIAKTEVKSHKILSGKANRFVFEADPKIYDMVLVRIIPVSFNADINNDGSINNNDRWLLDASEKAGASVLDVEKGMEYIFVNDKISNGEYDVEDSLSAASGRDCEDDDCQKIEFYAPTTPGEIWFDHPAISGLTFYKDRACKLAVQISASDPLNTVNSGLSGELFVKSDDTVFLPDDKEVIGALRLMFKPEKSSEAIVVGSINLTIVKAFGAKSYFSAALDYIYEKNAKYFTQELRYPGITEDSIYRLVCMREKATSCFIQDTYNHTEDRAMESGIEEVAESDEEADVIINGNQCFLPDGIADSNKPYPFNMTTQCDGRICSVRKILVPPSNDTHNPNLGGIDGKFFGLDFDGGGDGVIYKFGCGPIPSSSPSTPLHGIGGLIADCAKGILNAAETQAVGRGRSNSGEGVVFTATCHIDSVGEALKLRFDAEDSGVSNLSGGTAFNYELLFLDGSSSVGLVLKDPNENNQTIVKGKKHSGIFYYINTYVKFVCRNPR